jgi:ribosome-associated protein
MQKFKLEKEYIHLNQLIKLLNWVESGGEANQIISDSFVFVNGEIELRKRYKVRVGDIVQFDENTIDVY